MQRGSRALACRFLENLNSCIRDTISQLCADLPSQSPAESIFSCIHDQHGLWRGSSGCALNRMSCDVLQGTYLRFFSRSSQGLPHLVLLINLFNPFLSAPTNHTSFSISPTTLPSFFRWKREGLWKRARLPAVRELTGRAEESSTWPLAWC